MEKEKRIRNQKKDIKDNHDRKDGDKEAVD